QIGRFEQSPELLRGHLGLGRFHLALHERAELHLHTARHDDAMIALEQIRDAALAGLAVHANDAVVGTTQVRWIHRDVRHFPDRVLALYGHALLDRVLVRARERGEDQVAHVRVARMDGQPGGLLYGARDGVD